MSWLFGTRFDPKVFKPNLKMAVHRIKLKNSKTSIEVRKGKREVAELIGQKKYEKARIRAEAIIRKEDEMEAHEILELMCDLLHERTAFIKAEKECPEDLRECAATMIWASNRTQIAELNTVRKQLVAKYGDEFAAAATSNRTHIVNAKVEHRLSVKPPTPRMITKYLEAIAAEHSVEYSPADEEAEDRTVLAHDRDAELDDVPPMMPEPGPGGYPTRPAPVTGSEAAQSPTAASHTKNPAFRGPDGWGADVPPAGYSGPPPVGYGGPPPAGYGGPPPAGYGGPPPAGYGGPPPAGYGGPPPAAGFHAPPPAGYQPPPAGYGAPPSFPGGVPPMMPPAKDPAPGPAGPPPSYWEGAGGGHPASAGMPDLPAPPTGDPAGPGMGVGGSGGAGGEDPTGGVPSFEDLSSRFAELRKR